MPLPGLPEERHFTRLLDILGYLQKFPHLGLRYPICKDGSALFSITCKVDESFADCALTRHTTFGFVVYLDGCPIAWKSRKTPFVTTGTASTAYVAMNFACREALFSKFLLSFLGFNQQGPILIMTDNQAAARAVNHKNVLPLTKHLDTMYHFVREHCTKGTARGLWINRTGNESDILSRPVEATLFSKLRDRLVL